MASSGWGGGGGGYVFQTRIGKGGFSFKTLHFFEKKSRASFMGNLISGMTIVSL